MTMTTTQHSALGDLTRFGRLYPSSPCTRGTVHGFGDRTLAELVRLGHAKWATVRDYDLGPGMSVRTAIVPPDAPEDPLTGVVTIGQPPVVAPSLSPHRSQIKHLVEQQAQVYLVLDEESGEWLIDPITFDSGPLEGYDDGPEMSCLELDQAGHDNACERGLAMCAAAPHVPSGRRLAGLLARALVEHDRREEEDRNQLA